MLQADKPDRFRPLVADEDAQGATRVVANINAVPSGDDVMRPVRESLGMGIADAIGLGGTTVISEGMAERYALLAMSAFCRKAGKAALPETTTVLPTGGSGKKMLPFVGLAASEKTKAVVLVDDDKAGRDTAAMIEKTLPGAVAVVRVSEENGQTNHETEDLFDRAYYVGLVNDAHRDVPGFKPLRPEDLDPNLRTCEAVEAAFKTAKLGKFQKLRVALELGKRVELNETPDGLSLENFAELFTRLNDALE